MCGLTAKSHDRLWHLTHKRCYHSVAFSDRFGSTHLAMCCAVQCSSSCTALVYLTDRDIQEWKSAKISASALSAVTSRLIFGHVRRKLTLS